MPLNFEVFSNMIRLILLDILSETPQSNGPHSNARA